MLVFSNNSEDIFMSEAGLCFDRFLFDFDFFVLALILFLMMLALRSLNWNSLRGGIRDCSPTTLAVHLAFLQRCII